MSIEKQLESFSKTDKFKKAVMKKMKTDPQLLSQSNGNSSNGIIAIYAERIKDILRNEIIDIKSSATNESFFDHIIVSEEFIPGTGWAINVSFDEDKMYRDSLYQEKYPDGVLLNEIFNEGYNAKNYVYGTWQEEDIRSKKQRDALYFIQRAVNTFNAEQKGKAVAQYNSKYTGGTI